MTGRHEAGLRKSKVLDHRISRNGSKFLNFNYKSQKGRGEKDKNDDGETII